MNLIIALFYIISSCIAGETQTRWSIRSSKQKSETTLEFTDSTTKKVTSYNHKEDSQSFVDSEELEAPNKHKYLSTLWTHGIHSHMVLLFDPDKSSQPVAKFVALEEPELTPYKDGFKVRLVLDTSKEDPRPKEFFYYWDPKSKGKPKLLEN